MKDQKLLNTNELSGSSELGPALGLLLSVSVGTELGISEGCWLVDKLGLSLWL